MEKKIQSYSSRWKSGIKAKHITKLKIGQNKYTREPKEILNLQKNFYENLYNCTERSSDFDDFFLTNLPQLNTYNVELTERPLTLEELSYVIKHIKSGKSPGSDGLTSEFYKFFWNDIKFLVFDSLSYANEYGKMSEEQRRAVLRLIPKKDKDVTELKNWRPISLLNTDYKILAHVLSNRLQHVLPEIISKDQNAYMKGRFIGFNIRTILDIIEITNLTKMETIIAFLDFEKAFDKLNWGFIDKCLSSFGFGATFRKWVSIMYNDISSCVINNGYTTGYFKLKCGIRQGCPLSALLFIIAAETLACSIRKNENIHGVTINSKEIKLSQLADDTTLFLNDINSLQIALNTLFMFYKSSGLKLNYTKTEVLSIGFTYGNKANPFQLKWVKERVYALGTWFYKDMTSTITKNHESRFSAFQSILKTWKPRYLSLLGKITIIKSLAISKLNYCIMTLPTPEWFVKAVQAEITAFLWDGKPPKIKYHTAVSCYANGGIKLTDMDSFVKSQKAAWSKRLLDIDQPSSQYLMLYVDAMTLYDLLNCSMDPKEIPADIPEFYRQVLHAWFNYKCISGSILTQNTIIWNNNDIKIEGKSVFFRKWYEKCILYLKDITAEKGVFFHMKGDSKQLNF